MGNQFLHNLSEMLFEDAAEKAMLEQLYHAAYKQLELSIELSEKTQKMLKVALDTEIDINTQLPSDIGDQPFDDVDKIKLILNNRIAEEAQRTAEFMAAQADLRSKIPAVDLSKPVTFNEKCIRDFAKKFTNIQDMTITLADAPPSVRKFLPQLYQTVFVNLDKKQQEEELRKLVSDSPDSVKIILDESISTYNATTDLKLKLESKQLVHMILFEMIQQRTAAISADDDPVPNDKKRIAFLTELMAQIPDVGASDILDTFDDYRNAAHQSVGNLLYRVDKPLSIDTNTASIRQVPRNTTIRAPSPHVEGEEKIEEHYLKEHQLREKLRFGRSDLRDHVQRYQKNTGRDLFWARNIRDLEMFSTEETKQMFADLELFRLMKSTEIKPVSELKLDNKKIPKSFMAILKKFSDALHIFTEKFKRENYEGLFDSLCKQLDDQLSIRNDRSKSNDASIQELLNQFINQLVELKINGVYGGSGTLNAISVELPRGVSINLSDLKPICDNKKISLTIVSNKNNHDPKVTPGVLFGNMEVRDVKIKQIAQIQQALNLCNSNFEIKADGDGNINIGFFYTSVLAKGCRDAIKVQKGFGNNADTLVMALVNRNKLSENNCISNQFSGTSLSEIKAKIQALIDTHEQFLGTHSKEEIGTGAVLRLHGDDNHENSGGAQNAPKQYKKTTTPRTAAAIAKKAKQTEQENAAKKQEAARQKSALQLEAYKNYIKVLEKKEQEVQYKSIADLKLPANDELVLRKIIELHNYYHKQPTISRPENLKPIFDLIAEGKYSDAVKAKPLVWDEHSATMIPTDPSALVDKDYAEIAKKELALVPPTLRKFVEKAKTMTQSNTERETKSNAYKAIWTSELRSEEKIKQLTELYATEYTEMNDVLGLTELELDNLKHHAEMMAKDLVRLTDRVASGEPLLTPGEQTAYFKAISDIKTALSQLNPPIQFKNIAFKIKHTSTGQQTIEVKDKNGETHALTIRLSTTLPYSLIKPLGDNECIFSFGGSRENVAPLARLETIYGKKNRFFTASRELGEGQYGSVKLARGLLSGVNYAIKKGTTIDAFKETARQNPKLRGRTRLEDPLAKAEYDAQMRLKKTQIDENSLDGGFDILYSEARDKPRVVGELFKTETINEYTLITRVAPGSTLADLAQEQLSQYSKGEEAYHNPLKRPDAETHLLDNLIANLTMAEDIVSEAEQFARQFSHNDIKPENVMVKKMSDGHYKVSFIDWATQGSLGVNPRLQILHGPGFNCTPAYISTAAVWKDGQPWESPEGNNDDTIIKGNDPVMDDLALTGLAFGICNRKAYFTTLKGRIVNDYTVSGVLSKDASDHLIIDDNEQFNKFFACEEKDKMSNTSADDPSAVMYIPSSKRNGEPLHLYRLLKGIQANCDETPEDADKKQISETIQAILDRVHLSMESGIGLPKSKLKALCKEARDCVNTMQKMADTHQPISSKNAETFQEAVERSKNRDVSELSTITKPNLISDLEILCTYPKSKEEEALALPILEQITPVWLCDDVLSNTTAPSRNLLKHCISGGQSTILALLLKKIKKPELQALVREQGLLHHALQQQFRLNQVDMAKNILGALTDSGMNDEDLFTLMMQEYGPHENQLPAPPDLLWSTNAFHIAIRNNHYEQLRLILKYLPKGHANDSEIKKALHLAALKYRPELFDIILDTYNKKNSTHPFNQRDILEMKYPPDNMSPYHLFLRQAATIDKIPLNGFTTDDGSSKLLGQAFLLTPPAYPCLIAAAHGHYQGIKALLQMAGQIDLTDDDKKTLLTQTDAYGKNILNYLLEQHQIGHVSEFIKDIRTLCPQNHTEIMRDLITHPHPTNPLRKFLDASDDPSIKFAGLKQLLDAVCIKQEGREFPPEEQQKARLMVLLVHYDWLIKQAQDSKNNDHLRQLLRDTALSIPNQQILFKILLTRSPDNSEARELFNHYFSEVMLGEHDEIQRQTTLLESKIPSVLKEVALQRNDHNEFLRLLAEREQKLILAFKQHVAQLTIKLAAVENKWLEQTRLVAVAQEESARLAIDIAGQEILFAQEKIFLEEKFKLALSSADKDNKDAIHQITLAHEDEIKTLTTQHEQKKTESDQSLKQSKERVSLLNKSMGGVISNLEKLRKSKAELSTLVQSNTAETKQAIATFAARLLILEENEKRLEINVAELHGANALLDQQVHTLTEGNTSLQSTVVNLNTHISLLQTQLTTTEELVQTTNNQVEILSAQLTLQEKETAAVQEKMRTEKQQYEDEYRRLENALKEAEESNSNTISNLDAQLAELTEQHAQKELASSRQLKQYDTDNQALSKQVGELQSALNSEQARREVLVENLRGEIRGNEAQLAQRQEELTPLYRNIDALQRQINANKEKGMLTEEESSVKVQVALWIVQHERFSANIIEQTTINAQLKSELNEDNVKLEQAKLTVDQIHHAASQSQEQHQSKVSELEEQILTENIEDRDVTSLLVSLKNENTEYHKINTQYVTQLKKLTLQINSLEINNHHRYIALTHNAKTIDQLLINGDNLIHSYNLLENIQNLLQAEEKNALTDKFSSITRYLTEARTIDHKKMKRDSNTLITKALTLKNSITQLTDELTSSLQTKVSELSMKYLNQQMTTDRFKETLKQDTKGLQYRFGAVFNQFEKDTTTAENERYLLDQSKKDLASALEDSNHLQLRIQQLNQTYNSVTQQRSSTEIGNSEQSQLNAQLERGRCQYEEDKAALTRELEELTKKTTEISQKVQKQQQQITSLQLIMRFSHQALSDIIEGSERLIKNKESFSEEDQTLANTLAAKSKELQQKINSLYDNLETCETQNVELQTSVESLTQNNTQSLYMLTSVSSQVERLTSHITLLSAQLDEKAKETHAIRTELAETKQTLATSQKKQDATTQRIQGIKDKIKQLTLELKTAIAENTHLRKKLGPSKTDKKVKNRLKKELLKQLTTIKTAQKTIQDLQVSQQAMSTEHGALTQSLAERTIENTELKTTQEELQQQFDQVEEQLEEKTTEIQQLTTKQARIRESIQMTQQQSNELKETITILNRTYRRNMTRLTAKFDRTKSRYRAVVAQLKNKLKDANARYPAKITPDQVVTTTPIDPPTPPLKKQKTTTPLAIFASLQEIEKTSLFVQPDDPVITINYTYTELEPEQIKQFKSEGLYVHSPSGQQFNLSMIKNGEAKAIMTQEDAKADENENEAKYKQRIAVTIISMIDNVLAYSDHVEIKTEDPFIAAIANEYIQFLTNKIDVQAVHFTVETNTEDTNGIHAQKASEIFDKLKLSITQHLNQVDNETNGTVNKSFVHFKKQYQIMRKEETGQQNDPENPEPR